MDPREIQSRTPLISLFFFSLFFLPSSPYHLSSSPRSSSFHPLDDHLDHLSVRSEAFVVFRGVAFDL
jgi:hypothetical protein